jgi:glycosyltransferase involved in cell wall biosynthesis
LEAAACGVPAIGTLDCGAEDAIVHGVTGLLVEQTVDSVRQALERLLTDEPVRKQLGVAALAHAQQSSWLDNAERVAALYRTALQRHGGSA